MMVVNPALGRDLSCLFDLDAGMVEVAGRTCLAQAIWRRLSTPRGLLLDDNAYGFDLPGEINDDLSPIQIARISSRIVAECKKDERVLNVTAPCSFIGGTLTVLLTITDGAGPFRLTMVANAQTVTLLEAA